MKRFVCLVACLVSFFIVFSNSVEAALFDFSYTFTTGDVLSGVLDGVLQPDNNTVIASSPLLSASFSGNPGLSFQLGLMLSTATLDGIGVRLLTDLADPGVGLGGFGFDESGTVLAFVAESQSSNLILEFYSDEGWSLSPQQAGGAIPEPTTLVLFAVGFLGILGLGYRQHKHAS